MRKITEHTYGAHIYMMLTVHGRREEIDVYLLDSGTVYRTTGDRSAYPVRRARIIRAFNKLY